MTDSLSHPSAPCGEVASRASDDAPSTVTGAAPTGQDAPHDCIARINRLLAEKKMNTVIATAINFSNPVREMIQIATTKDNVSLRGKPVAFYASYCPFCGVKLEGDSDE